MMNNILHYQFWRELKKLPFVEKITLYGSRAREDHSARSDIDIAIFCPKATESDWQTVLDTIEKADTLLPIDCIREDKLSRTNPLLFSIQRDGKIIYMRGGGMSQIQFIENRKKLEKALLALKAMVNKPMEDDRSNIDATIQRFEFTIELFWKTLKYFLADQGIDARYPKEILRAAYTGNLIDQESVWLSMLNDRNLTSHSYNEELADEIYEHIITTYYPLLEKTVSNLYFSS